MDDGIKVWAIALGAALGMCQVWRVCCVDLLEGRLTSLLVSVEGISVKMFLRGRPITMYIPSGIRSLEELPSGPPPETLSLDWVYPIPPSSMGTTPSHYGSPFFL